MAEQPEYFSEQHDQNQARFMFGDTVSGNYFQVLGVTAMLGRTFVPEEDSPAAGILAVLSYEGWQARFQSDPNVVGARIKLNGQPVTIAGVLPRSFPGTRNHVRPEIYVPLAAAARLFPLAQPLSDPRSRTLQLLGRLRDGVDVRAAQTELAALEQRLQQGNPPDQGWRKAVVLSELDSRIQEDNGQNLRFITVMLGIGELVLLIASVNVANLLLGRASARVKEIAIRQSVGASRGRLLVQLFTESAVLAILGAGAGLFLAFWAVQYLNSIQLPFDFPFSLGVRMDRRVLLFTVETMVVSVLVFGLWPAIRATKVDLVSSAKTSVRPSRVSPRNLLVALQTALAVMLLIPASLFFKCLAVSSTVSPGFRVDNVLTLRVSPPLAGYSVQQTEAFYGAMQRRMEELPGVESAALATHLVMGGDNPSDVVGPQDAGSRDAINAMFNQVTPEYFSTMAIPIVEGRPFTNSDSKTAPPVAIVTQALARKFWPNGNALGQRIRLGSGDKPSVMQIVGIAGDAKYQDAVDRMEPYLYIAYRQHEAPDAITLLVHTTANPYAVLPAIRQELKALASDVPVFEVHTMRELFEGHGLLAPRLAAQMAGVMGGIGLTLGIVGLYAVVAFAVSRRIREIGIRMALGATSGSVLRGVVASGAKMALAGIALGLVGAFLITRYLGEFLDRVNPHDPWAFTGVAALMLAVTVAACWSPARRASKVDPAITLRYE